MLASGRNAIWSFIKKEIGYETHSSSCNNSGCLCRLTRIIGWWLETSNPHKHTHECTRKRVNLLSSLEKDWMSIVPVYTQVHWQGMSNPGSKCCNKKLTKGGKGEFRAEGRPDRWSVSVKRSGQAVRDSNRGMLDESPLCTLWLLQLEASEFTDVS